MIKDIIEQVNKFYNKRVIFSPFDNITEKTRSFKLIEEKIDGITHILIARIEEYEDHVEITKLMGRTIEV